MLILTRKIGDSIIIGDNIKVTVVNRGRSGSLRLAVEAPKEIKVIREELLKSTNNVFDRLGEEGKQ